MQLLNPILKTEGESVVFPFRPVEIPVNHDNVVVNPDIAEYKLYSAIVWRVEAKEFAVFQFDEYVMSALIGYQLRHNGISHLEFKLGRFPDGKLRFTLLKEGLPAKTIIPENLYVVAHGRSSKLFDRYQKLVNYKMEV
jgi:hypothetical protein